MFIELSRSVFNEMEMSKIGKFLPINEEIIHRYYSYGIIIVPCGDNELFVREVP